MVWLEVVTGANVTPFARQTQARAEPGGVFLAPQRGIVALQVAYATLAANFFPSRAQIICATYRPESADGGNPPPVSTHWPAM